jgi:P-type conjugative transfer protein TrbJ
MRRRVKVAAVAFVVAILSARGTSAQTYGIPATTGGIVAAPRTIPAVACPPNPFNGGGWNLCNSFQQWVGLYNEGVRLQNELNEIRQNTLRYATYPQKTQGYVQADLTRLESIIDRTNGLSITDRSIESTISRIFPDYPQGGQYTDLTKQLAQATTRSVINSLKVAGLDVGSTARDAATADIVKDAVARATSPTQATQALAQLTAVMIEQLQKQQRIEGSSLNAAAAYYLSQSKSAAAKAQADAIAISSWKQFSTVSLPTLTPAQAKAIVGIP